MSLKIPTIDDRSYREILAEAIERIEVHNPEWTNHGDADPGITVLQLFAFMTESLLYRANQIPTRNRLKFLSLLGESTRPAQAARGLVAFSAPRARLEVTSLAPGLALAAGPTPFSTEDGVDVLPIEGRVYYKATLDADEEAAMRARYEPVYAAFVDDPSALAFYETRPFEDPSSASTRRSLSLAEDAVDGSLWIALLARSAADVETTRDLIAQRRLTLGVMPELSAAEKVLAPGGAVAAEASRLDVYVPSPPANGLLPDEPELRIPQYRQLDTKATEDVIGKGGVIEVSLPSADALRLWSNLEPTEAGTADFPPSLEDDAVADRLVTWLRIRPPSTKMTVRLSWLGINASRVVQRQVVRSEIAGVGSGAPDQAVRLAQRGIDPSSLVVTVGEQRFSRIDDLFAAAPEAPNLTSASTPTAARVFQLDADEGTLTFGNGLHGVRPPAGARIVAAYGYGGGVAGNVGLGAIRGGPALPPGVKVTNPVPTWGGTDPETADEAERRIPQTLRHRDRLVSKADFQELTEQTPGVDIARVEVLPLFYPPLPAARAEGVVTVLVIPRNDPEQPLAPRPDRPFLEAVCQHLEPRRLVTTELYVRGPTYVPILVSIGVSLIPGFDSSDVERRVEAAIRTFLSPIDGGFEGGGWPLSKAVESAEILATAARERGVAKVNGVLLGDAAANVRAQVDLVGLELPRILAISVTAGGATAGPQSLESLIADRAPVAEVAPRVPVPVLPEKC